LKFLRDEGLIAPDEISPDDDTLPLDFTRLNNRQIGAVHSRYAVRHSHAIYVAAGRASALALLKRDLRLVQADFRFRNKKKFKTKYELDDAMHRDNTVTEILDKMVKLEAQLEVIKALADGYEDVRNAASREMYRRFSEQAPKD
jgi:hypothetical protein